MKRVKGGDMVIMGRLEASNSKTKFNLFDGKYTTGFKIKRFTICDSNPTADHEAAAKLSTVEMSVSAIWNWSNVEEVGWAVSNAPNDIGPLLTPDQGLLRPDSLIIEDLYLACYNGSDGRKVNYYIELEKYEFTAWDGAANMVRNQSQAGPPA